MLGVSHRQTAPPGSQETDADQFYNQYRHNILYVQFYLLESMIQVNIITFY